jgi:deoxyhypusine synthase
MYDDDKYMFCAVRVNDLFIVNNEWRELDRLIYTVLTKLMRRQGSIQQSNT